MGGILKIETADKGVAVGLYIFERIILKSYSQAGSLVSAPGGRLGSNYAWMCVSESEGHGSFFSFKGVK